MKAIITKDRLIVLLTAIILVAGCLGWISGLSADPPTLLMGLGQSLSTDPAHCVYHARNKVLFDDSDPFDYPRWVVFQRSIVSSVAYIWFAIFGVSLVQANMIGVLLSIGALAFFILAVARHHPPWATMALTACYLWNITLIVHGRVPYLENGLMFVMSLLFFIYSWWGDRLWGVCLSGAVVSIAVLTGKLFGILLLPALLLAEWFSGHADRTRRILLSAGTFVIATVVLVLVLYATNLSSMYAYYRDGAYSLRGFPEGLASPWGFIEHLLSYGFDNRLYPLSWDLPVFLCVSGFLLTYLWVRGQKPENLSRISALSMFAAAFVILGLMPQNYSPLRYGLILIPSLLILCFTLVDSAGSIKDSGPVTASYAKFILLLLVVWQALYQIIGLAFFLNNTPTRALTWSTLPFAILIVYFVRHSINRRKKPIGKTALNIALVVMVLFSLVVNTSNINKWLLVSPSRSIAAASEDLAKILDPGAVVSGPYAPVLTLDNSLKSFVYYFGVAKVDSSLLNLYPITHVAIDYANWEEAVRNYPILRGLSPITSYGIRDYEVQIYNIAGLTGNKQADRYQPTAFERAIAYRNREQYHEAFAEINTFLNYYPRCWSGNVVLLELLMRSNQYERAVEVLNGLANRHPYDYSTNIIIARSYQVMGTRQNNSNWLTLARRYYDKAAGGDSFRAKNARRIYQMTAEQLNDDAASPGASP